MPQSDIDRCFRVLGLDSNASFAQVKDARSWYTKAFHPDRFPKNSKDFAKAEETQKEINLAYEDLKKWFETGPTDRSSQRSRPHSQPKKRAPDQRKSWKIQLAEYLSFLQNSGKSRATVKNTYSDLRMFATWLQAIVVDTCEFHTIDLEECVVAYAYTLSEEGYSPATIARHLYSVRGMLNHAYIDCRFVLPLASEYKSHIRPQTKALTEKQLRSFLKAVDTDAVPDEEAMISFILHTGVSASELCALRWRDVTMSTMPGHRHKCVIIEVTGRSGKRQVPLNEPAVSALDMLGLDDIFRSRGKLLDRRIFTRNGYNMTPKMVHYTVDRFATISHTAVTPSILRNTFSRKLANAGVPRQHLAELIGVTDQSAKLHYSAPKANINELLAAVNKA